MSGADVEELIRQNKISGGMILKLEASKRALAGGVREVRIVGGTRPGALLSAANGAKGPGTRVTPMFDAEETQGGIAMKRKTSATNAAQARRDESRLFDEYLPPAAGRVRSRQGLLPLR